MLPALAGVTGTAAALVALLKSRGADIWGQPFTVTNRKGNVVGFMADSSPYGWAASAAIGRRGVVFGWHFSDLRPDAPDFTVEWAIAGPETDSPG